MTTRKDDTAEYSSSEAPKTREHAKEQEGNYSDMRLIPGGAHGSKLPQGMDALDRDTVPTGAIETAQTRDGESPDDPEGKTNKPR